MGGLRRTSRDERGASLVEFAVILPMLMLVLFGVLEFGRYVALVHAVETGSRTAARYAATTGGTTPHYVDCDGIRAVVRDTVLISPPDGDIDITYENDLGPLPIGCQGALTPPTIDAVGPETRVKVTVRYTFRAITPIVGDFLNNVPIDVSDERTIVKTRL